MTISVFTDKGYQPGIFFCEQFLNSKEFNNEDLKKLIPGSKKGLDKNKVAGAVAKNLQQQSISPSQVTLLNIEMPRKWLALYTGKYSNSFTAEDPTKLLFQFGEVGWYGPIRGSAPGRLFYVKTHRIADYKEADEVMDNYGSKRLRPNYIRWPIIAEVSENYLALHWDNFGYHPHAYPLGSVQKRTTPFEYWRHVRDAYSELKNSLGGSWSEIPLSNLILDTIWDKYLYRELYRWKHRRVAAEKSGVFVNARIGGQEDSDDKYVKEFSEDVLNGLEILANKLGRVAVGLSKPGIDQSEELILKVQRALLQTIIKDWGPVSYEFSLEKHQSSNPTKKKIERIFRGHAYFGSHPDADTPDSLRHILCFSDFGGSTTAKVFLLKELGITH
jgi:hypothetical protein